MLNNLLAKDLLSQNFKDVSLDATLSDALKLFDGDTDVLIVKDSSNSAKGVLTEWMILKSGLNRSETRVRKLMRPFPKISLNEPLSEVLRLMIENNLYKIPVLEGGKVLGVVDDKKILEALMNDNFGAKRINKLFNGENIFVSDKDSVGRLLSLFKELQVDKLPVVSSGRVVGVVSVKDVLLKLFKVKERPEFGTIIDEKPSIFDTPVEAVMDVSVPYVLETSTLKEVVDKLLSQNLDSIVVVDVKDRLKFLLTRKDILLIVYESLRSKPELIVQLASKEELDNFDKEQIKEEVERFLSKYSDTLGESKVYLNLKKYKQKFRGKSLFYSKIRLSSSLGSLHARGKGFGVANAVKNCLENLERVVFKG